MLLRVRASLYKRLWCPLRSSRSLLQLSFESAKPRQLAETDN